MKFAQIALAIMAVALSTAAQGATDGTPGTTSTGTFNATVTAAPPVGTQVQVSGLTDFNFNPVTVVNGPSSGFQSITRSFCLARSTQGDVNVTIFQSGVANGGQLNLNLGGANSAVFVPISLFNFRNPNSNSYYPVTKSGDSFQGERNGPDCIQTNALYQLQIEIPRIVSSDTAASGGNFSGQFTLLVAPL